MRIIKWPRREKSFSGMSSFFRLFFGRVVGRVFGEFNSLEIVSPRGSVILLQIKSRVILGSGEP